MGRNRKYTQQEIEDIRDTALQPHNRVSDVAWAFNCSVWAVYSAIRGTLIAKGGTIKKERSKGNETT